MPLSCRSELVPLHNLFKAFASESTRLVESDLQTDCCECYGRGGGLPSEFQKGALPRVDSREVLVLID